MFNSCNASRPTSTSTARSHRQMCISAHGRLGWTFWVCEDLLSAGELERTCVGDIPKAWACMALRVRPACTRSEFFRRRVRRLRMTLRAVADERTRLEFAHIASVVFSLPF